MRKADVAPNPNPPKMQEKIILREEKEAVADKALKRKEASVKEIETSEKNFESKKKGKKEKKIKKEKPEKTVKKDRLGTVMLLVTGVLLVIIAFLFNAGFFAGKNGELDTSMLAGVLVAALGIDFFVYRKAKAKKEGMVSLPEEKPKKQKKADKKKVFEKRKSEQILEKQGLAEKESAIKESAIKEPEKKVPYQEKTPQIEEYIPQENDVTEYMDAISANAGGEKTAYLENAMGERFYLTQEHTRIGSQAAKVDFVLKNKKISRLHAEIYRKEGMYYLMDMNSSNGTYLNHASEALAPCVEYSLASGDSVRFANEEYIFRVVC